MYEYCCPFNGKLRVAHQEADGTLSLFSALTYLHAWEIISTPFSLSAGFFLTPAAEKTKTQGQNSSKKLKEKTQPLGGRSLPYAKLKKKLKLMKFSPQNSKFSKG